MNKITEAMLEHLILAALIILDTLLIILMLACFKLIDIVLHYLGFQNDVVSAILHGLVHPATLLAFFVVFILNVLHNHVPRGSPEPRFEIIQVMDEEEKSHDPKDSKYS